MLNNLMSTKMYSFGAARYNFQSKLSTVNFENYFIPEELIMERIPIFKGYKYPFNTKIIEYVENKRIIPVDLNEPSVKSCKTGNLHINMKLPRSLFSMILPDKYDPYNDDKKIVLADLSFKGKYSKTPQGQIFYYDIPDIIMYHMLVGAFVNYKLNTDKSLSENPSLFTKVAECYSLILTKIIDNIVPIAQVSNTDFAKLHYLVQTFCLQNMFGLNKEEAAKYAIKSKFVIDKHNVHDSSVYINSNLDFMVNPDKSKFPIDTFVEILYKEYAYITEKNLTSIELFRKFIERFTNNATFALEHSTSFINMLIFGKAGIMIFNDKIIKDYLALNSYDITKELAVMIK